MNIENNQIVLDKHYKIAIPFLILISTGVFFFTFDDLLWKQLYRTDQYQSFFLCVFGVSIFLSTWLIRENNFKIVASVSLLTVISCILSIWFLPIVTIWYIVFGLLGLGLGMLQGVVYYVSIYGISPENRSRIIIIGLFFTYLIKYIVNELLPFGLNTVLPVILFVFVIIIFLNFLIDKREMISPRTLPDYPYPTKLIILLGLVSFVSYFETFLTRNGTGVLKIAGLENFIWLDHLIHLSIFLGFFIFVKRLDYIKILYVYLICTLLIYVLNSLGLSYAYGIVSLFSNVADALFDIFLFAIIPEIAFKHGKRHSVLSGLIFALSLGLFLASFLGDSVNNNLNLNHIYGLLLVVYCSYLFLLPFLIKYINTEIDEFKNSLRVVSIFNHSLKNMIVQVSCGIEILKKSHKTDNEKIQETFDIISDSLNQMMDIARHINTNTKEIKIVKEPCSVGEIIDSAINSIHLLTANRNINIVKSCEPNITLLCDKKRLKEALYNILKNSCEAIEKASGEIKIEVIKKRRKLICKISDNGKGIPPDQIKHMVKPFFTTKKMENNNYGLGLTHCYIVMEQHWGKIQIQSKEGVGTCISLIFPV